MAQNKNSTLVYSTDQSLNISENTAASGPGNKGTTAYIERDRKQRKGKVVTIVSQLGGDLKSLQKELQKQCGAGGSVKNGTIEIQGDHRDKIAAILQQKGYKTKFIGG